MDKSAIDMFGGIIVASNKNYFHFDLLLNIFHIGLYIYIGTLWCVPVYNVAYILEES